MKKHLSRLILAVSLLSLCACAKPSMGPIDKDADALWKNYAQSAKTLDKPFRNTLSLRYGVEGKTDRVSALLWGNSSQTLRLDISASVGITVAKIFESSDKFTLYIPQEEVAYVHEGENKASFNMGVPLPLSLEHVSLILQGHYATVFGLQFDGAPMPLNQADIALFGSPELPEDAVAYALEQAPFRGVLVLNSLGQPIFWQEDNSTGWIMEFAYREHAKLPYKLHIKHIDSQRKAIILVKERDSDLNLFTPEQMRLILPKETVLYTLKDLNPNQL